MLSMKWDWINSLITECRQNENHIENWNESRHMKPKFIKQNCVEYN